MGKASEWAIETWSLLMFFDVIDVGQPCSPLSTSISSAAKLDAASLSFPVAIVFYFDNDCCFVADVGSQSSQHNGDQTSLSAFTQWRFTSRFSPKPVL